VVDASAPHGRAAGSTLIADIQVVPKGRSNRWLWIIIAVLVVVGLLAWVMGPQQRPYDHAQRPHSPPCHSGGATDHDHVGGERSIGDTFSIA
jgi:hypothetical protein